MTPSTKPHVDVGPADALIVVEEDVRARADLARPRPRSRLLEQAAPPGEPRRARTGVFPAWNCRNQVGISGLRETSFANGGRVFSVTAIIGKAATGKTRSETLAVLRSLKPLAEERIACERCPAPPAVRKLQATRPIQPARRIVAGGSSATRPRQPPAFA